MSSFWYLVIFIFIIYPETIYANAIFNSCPEEREKCLKLTNNQSDLSRIAHLGNKGKFVSLVCDELIALANNNSTVMEYYVECLEGKRQNQTQCEIIDKKLNEKLKELLPRLRQELALASDESIVRSTNSQKINTFWVGDIQDSNINKRTPLSSFELNDITAKRDQEIASIKLLTKPLYAKMKSYPVFSVAQFSEDILREVQNTHYLNYLTILTAYPIFIHVSEDDIAKELKTPTAIAGIKAMIESSKKHQTEIIDAAKALLKEFEQDASSLELLKNKFNPNNLETLFSYLPIVEKVLSEHPELCSTANRLYREVDIRATYRSAAEQLAFIMGLKGVNKITSTVLKKAPNLARAVNLTLQSIMIAPMIYPYWKNYESLKTNINHLGEGLGGVSFATQKEVHEAKESLLRSPIEVALMLTAFHAAETGYGKIWQYLKPMEKGSLPPADFLGP